MGRRQPPDQLRPGDQHADPGASDGSIYDRALVNLDTNNFAPRIGVAYSLDAEDRHPRRPTASSYVQFNRLGGENLLSFNGPHVVPITITQQPSQGLCVGQPGADDLLPHDPGGLSGRPDRAGELQPDQRPRQLHPAGQQDRQHPELARHRAARAAANLFVVDVAYVGNRSRNLMILGDFNQARPNATGENSPLQARRPIQGYQFIQAAFDGGKGDYRALQVKVERRYSRGLYLLNSFTWSRARDNASGHLETANGDNSRVNFADIDGEFGLSGYNQPLNNTTTVVWELPFGRGRRWAQQPAAGARGRRRRVAADRHQHDDERPAGEPELLAGRRPSTVSTVPTYRPNVSGDIYAPTASRPSTTGSTRPTSRSRPTSAQPFGNAPRNVARGPGALRRSISACTRGSRWSARPASSSASRRSTS